MATSNQRSRNPNKEGQAEPLAGRRRFLRVAAASALGAGMGLVSASGAEAIPEVSPQATITHRRRRTRTINIDFSNVIGTIKPLNGVNGGPIVTRGAFDLSSNFAELGIKHIRLHDVPWMYENAVDINYVFPRAEADADDPQSYDFFLTDYYLKSIRSLGAEVTFRLGYSAEWKYHPPIHNVPPKDFREVGVNLCPYRPPLQSRLGKWVPIQFQVLGNLE